VARLERAPGAAELIAVLSELDAEALDPLASGPRFDLDARAERVPGLRQDEPALPAREELREQRGEPVGGSR